jgi:hypothetical protein
MPHHLLAFALVAVLGADAPPPRILSRSSIAAVIARRAELGLDDGQVRQLEERDAALHARLAELRGRPGGGGRYGAGRHGTAGGNPAAAPSTRGADLQHQLDDADTQAWLEAESVLAERQREPARAVAEKYREARADQRGAAGKKRK